MGEEKGSKKSGISSRIAFIIRFVFLGFISWSYFTTIYTIFKKGTIGVVIGLAALIMYGFFAESLNPIKMFSDEFGKYTKIVGALTSGIIMVCLFLIFGLGFK